MLEDMLSLLEGVEIMVSGAGASGKITIKGRVVACDPDIGITIVDAENSENYIVCIDCRNKHHIRREDAVAAKSMFNYMLYTIINTGTLDIDEAISFLYKMNFTRGSAPSAENCVFNR